MRFPTELDASGQRSETIREGDTPLDAALEALKGWHRDARITNERGRVGEDTRGTYTEFAARVGSSWGFIKVRDPIRTPSAPERTEP